MKTFKGFIIGLIIGIVATFAFAYTCMDSYFAMVMEKIHNVVQVFDNDNTSSSSSSENYDDLTIDEKVALLDEGEAISPGVDKKTLVEKSILKDEIFSQHEELYYVVISVEISGVLHSYLDLMEENSDMPKIYFYYDDDWSFDEYDDDGNEIINVINVSTVEELKCSLTILTIQNGVCVGCPERTEEMEHTEIYDNKIREIYREYLESKKNS